MKKNALSILLCIITACLVLLLTGCMQQAPEPEAEPTEIPTQEPTATPFLPTPLPTITPRPVLGSVETPAPGTTAVVIDPMDKPTREPLVFEFAEYVSQDLGISFEIPRTWTASTVEGNSNAIIFTEPASEAQDGYPSTVTISVTTFSTAQRLSDAESELDSIIAQLRATYGSMEVSSKADNSMMGEKGRYITYWIYVDTGEDEPLRTRGRILVVPKDRKLYQVRYLCPAEFNSDYETVFKRIRSTITEL